MYCLQTSTGVKQRRTTEGGNEDKTGNSSNEDDDKEEEKQRLKNLFFYESKKTSVSKTCVGTDVEINVAIVHNIYHLWLTKFL